MNATNLQLLRDKVLRMRSCMRRLRNTAQLYCDLRQLLRCIARSLGSEEVLEMPTSLWTCDEATVPGAVFKGTVQNQDLGT